MPPATTPMPTAAAVAAAAVTAKINAMDLAVQVTYTKPLPTLSHNHFTGCAVAQHCCKGDQSFQWESPNFAPPPYFQNPSFFPYQNVHR